MPIISEENKELCEKLWNEYEPRLRQLCRKKLDSYLTEADEVVSDAYLILCKAFAEEKEIKNPAAWLYGTVNNLIKEKYAEIKKHREKETSLFNYDNKLMYDIPYSFDFLEEIVSDFRIEDSRLDIVNNSLSEDEAQLLEYIYDDGMSYKKIAKLYDTTEDGIKQRAYRLRKKVHKFVKIESEKFI